jgi:hypothetical protein
VTAIGPLSTLRIAALAAILALAVAAGWLLGQPDRTVLPRITRPAQAIQVGGLQSSVTIAPLVRRP